VDTPLVSTAPEGKILNECGRCVAVKELPRGADVEIECTALQSK
jgi:hypothetical protein